jgi:hypothetical protein
MQFGLAIIQLLKLSGFAYYEAVKTMRRPRKLQEARKETKLKVHH